MENNINYKQKICVDKPNKQKSIIKVVDIFKYNVNATNFSQTFRGNTKLTSIPSNIFKENIKSKSFNFTFLDCNKVNGEVPTLWLNEYPNKQDTSGCFRNVPASNADLIPYNWK